MIKNQTSLFNINQYQLDKDFPGLLSVGQEKSIKLFFHGRRLQSVRGRQEKRGGVLVGSLTGTTTGGHVVRLADWLINVVDDVLVGNRSVDHSKSVDHFVPLFGSRLNSLAGYFGSAHCGFEDGIRTDEHNLLELFVSRTKGTHPIPGKQRLDMGGIGFELQSCIRFLIAPVS